jgi:hypothetical protein
MVMTLVVVVVTAMPVTAGRLGGALTGRRSRLSAARLAWVAAARRAVGQLDPLVPRHQMHLAPHRHGLP